jgi:hypothetical protein
MDKSSLITQEMKQYADFLESWKQHRQWSQEEATDRLIDLLTAHGKFDFLPSKSIDVVYMNKIEVDKVDFLDRIAHLCEDDLHKVLTFPHKIISATKWTHGSAWWDICIPWIIQSEASFAQDGSKVKSLYERLSQKIFAKPATEVHLALFKSPSEL